jgi:hypothetical protein
MMGPKQEAQAALFYEFSLENVSHKIIFCGQFFGTLPGF